MNDRTRDRLGRPVDATSINASDHGVDVDRVRTWTEAITTAQQLLDEGYPFAAHEVFEARWKHCPSNERHLWQGLAQWCVAITHGERGNPTGAQRLRQRAAEHLGQPEALDTAAEWGIDIEPVRAWLASGHGAPRRIGMPVQD